MNTQNSDKHITATENSSVAVSSLSDSILVIDSGVGGLSICQSILEQQPFLQIIYFSDSAYFPYGLLSEEELSNRLKFIVEKMLSLHAPKLVVLACNTVSTLVLPELRSLFSIPFVGVVPAIKPAAQQSQSKRIGLLATPATVKRPYTDQLIHDYAQGCEVIKVGTNELVVQAEGLLTDQAVNLEKIDQALAPLRDETRQPKVDTVVLGCTHFPFLKQYLQELMPGVAWIDSGRAIANRVTNLLYPSGANHIDERSTVLEERTIKPVHQLYFSKPIDHKAEFSTALKDLGFSHFKLHYFI